MTIQQRTIGDLPVVTSVTANTKIMVIVNPGTATSNNRIISIENIMATLPVNIGTTGNVNCATISINTSTTPANSISTTISDRQIWWDSSYIYVVTGPNTVKRASLSTF